MYLQRIELSGFKSFANRTVLEFPAPSSGRGRSYGITAIVGPNGSGKSNVVDAVRWVLGEQSLKLLRGKKSTDIIFAGSAKKAQMSLAEVSLYLNNEDGKAPIDYSEIVITRKLYRDGSSEYLLNKSEVRLFDIVMLLARANFGQNTYSVIGQGMVDKIVSASGTERKEFFDEATGVKQYQIKRDRSVGKLKRSRETATQVEAVLVELEPHLKNLTRQVERLRKRQEIEKELRELQERYYGTLWAELTEAYQVAAAAYNDRDKERLKLESEIGSFQEQFNELNLAASRSEEFDRLQREHAAIVEEQNALTKRLAVLKGTLEVEYTKRGQQNLAWLESKRDELLHKQRDLEAEHGSIGKERQSLARQREQLESELNELNAELTVIQNNLRVTQDELYRNKSGVRHTAAIDAARAVVDAGKTIGGVYGSVGDIMQVESRYEAALSATVGARLWAVVVDSDAAAVRAIKYLKEQRLPPVTFLPLSSLSTRRSNRDSNVLTQSGVIGYAADLVTTDRMFDIVIEHLFGSTLVVETADDARSVGTGRERMVTLEGDLFEKSGVIKGGYVSRGWLRWFGLGGEKGTSTAAQLAQIETLSHEVDTKNRRKDELVANINDRRLSERLADSREQTLIIELKQVTAEISKVERELNADDSPEGRDLAMTQLTDERAELEAKLAALISNETTRREALELFNSEEERKKQQIFQLQQDMHTRQLALNEIVAALSEHKVELARIDTRKEDVVTAMRQDLGEDYRPKMGAVEMINLEEVQPKILRLKRQLDLIGGTDPEIEAEYETVKARYEHLSAEHTDLDKAIIDLEKIVAELDKQIKKQFDVEFKKINADFSKYFKQLFEGGSAKLNLEQREVTEAEAAREEVAEAVVEGEPIDTTELTPPVAKPNVEDRPGLAQMGIEIEACPPGKKIKNINVLSGGEKTMTALALICAIIANNPSPFILFDEVDAALDESNSAKFGAIIEELAQKTQFIVITHNRAVMSRGDVLYGVTMQGDGISRLLGLRLDQAEAIVKE